ncbi:MAG: (2Fe-2S)-binding protein [Candidatus Aminicenantaceae bacterium]
MQKNLSFRLNGRPQKLTVDPERMLLWVLRTDLELTGAKHGCGEGYCGACTVLVDGEAVRSCQYPVGGIEGKEVITIEGLSRNGDLHALQQAFVAHDALQCGFCTPGMILSAYALLQKNGDPSKEEIVNHMEDNLCRCGSHTRIIRAIQDAASQMQGKTR